MNQTHCIIPYGNTMAKNKTMIKKVSKRKVALNLNKLTTIQKIQFARAVVIAMNGNANFPSPAPALTVISTDANHVETASIAAQTHAKGTSAQMHAMIKVLELSLRALANYVETIANADPDHAVAIIESAGLTLRKTNVVKPRILLVVSSGKGQVTLTCPAEKSGTYKWEFATGDPLVEANWKFLAEVRKSKTIQSGLQSATVYHFREWTFGLKGLGPVSQIVSTTVL
jgi:hypothetical protein